MATVEITQRCLEEDFADLLEKTAYAILKKLEILAVSPEFGKPLGGEFSDYRRMTFGRHRIIYRYHRQSNTVFVAQVGLRKGTDVDDVYAIARRLLRSGRLEESKEQARTAEKLNHLMKQVRAKVEDEKRKRQ